MKFELVEYSCEQEGQMYTGRAKYKAQQYFGRLALKKASCEAL